ncbi:hypothetical protein CE91St36_25850 [Christensenellaceae bacterium]|nr:hypothetical protein CE91St36_25850 [Christensenellaceae bacterium]BDF62432.1 hypothetical protein CE91St37_25820 [Christensenellaceae bacterium]
MDTIMEIKTVQKNGMEIAVIQSMDVLVHDTRSALDLVCTVKYETGCERIALAKHVIHEDFFRLSTGIAGEILQKFINYHVKFAVYGDFSVYASKPLQDFIYESNNGKDIFFARDEEEAVDRLSRAEH